MTAPDLDPRDAQRIAHSAAGADERAALDARTLAIVHRRGWLRMLAPRDRLGAEVPLPAAVRFLESLAQVDGSCAWFVTLSSGASWFAGFLPPQLARVVMGTPRVCLAGSGASSGSARRDGSGWRIEGTWAHATGAPHATHFTMNAMVDGAPKAFLVPADDVEVLDTWRSIGLRASASHAFRVGGAWVPHDHAFEIAPSAATSDGSLYRFPFAALAYVTLAANVAGIARHFIRLAPRAADTAALDAAREGLLGTLDEEWQRVGHRLAVDEEELRCRALAWAAVSRETVDALYPSCGLAAADPRTEINRVWRDLHTATQHALLRPS